MASVNVNGVRAAVRRGMPAWQAKRSPDVLCLQEIRATDALLHEALGAGWHGVHEEGAAKGRAGVAVLGRVPARAVRQGVGPAEFEGAGRWVEADYAITGLKSGLLTAISAYVHTGEAGTPRQDEKHRFLSLIHI